MTAGSKQWGRGGLLKGGSSELARVLNATSHDAYGMLSIRPIHVDAEVIEVDKSTWLKKMLSKDLKT